MDGDKSGRGKGKIHSDSEILKRHSVILASFALIPIKE